MLAGCEVRLKSDADQRFDTCLDIAVAITEQKVAAEKALNDVLDSLDECRAQYKKPEVTE